MNEVRPVEATKEHALLMKKLSQVMRDFNDEYPEVDTLEAISVLGCVAGACISSNPDPHLRWIARESVISTMDAAIDDFVKARQQRDLN